MALKCNFFTKFLALFKRLKISTVECNCQTGVYYYEAIGRYVGTGKWGKGKMVLRYDVYVIESCDQCPKTRRVKIANAIPHSRLYSKYNISI